MYSTCAFASVFRNNDFRTHSLALSRIDSEGENTILIVVVEVVKQVGGDKDVFSDPEQNNNSETTTISSTGAFNKFDRWKPHD